MRDIRPQQMANSYFRKSKQAGRKISHWKRIDRDKTQPGTRANIQEGMIARFRYGKLGVRDQRPLVLILRMYQGLLDGINLNYLYEQKVQEMFRDVDKLAPIEYMETPKQRETLSRGFLRVGLLNKKNPSGYPGELLWKQVIRPRFVKRISCYRSYKIKEISNIQVVYYNIDAYNKRLLGG